MPAQAATGFNHAKIRALMRGLLHDHNSGLQKMSIHALWPSTSLEGVEQDLWIFDRGFSTEDWHRPMLSSGGDRTADWQRGSSATG